MTRCNRCGECLAACPVADCLDHSLPAGKNGKPGLSLGSRLITGTIILVLFTAPLIAANQTGLFKTDDKPLIAEGTLQAKDIESSISYALITRHIIAPHPNLSNMIATFSIFKNPKKAQDLSLSKEFKSFFLDKRITSLAEDEEIMAILEKQDLPALTTHPKIKAIIQDDMLMKKLLRVGKKAYLNEAAKD